MTYEMDVKSIRQGTHKVIVIVKYNTVVLYLTENVRAAVMLHTAYRIKPHTKS